MSSKTTLRNFHVPLPEELYNELKAEAGRSKRPATVLVRQAIELWLRQHRRAALRQSITAYAAQHAGTPADLDEQLEAASVQNLLEESQE
jgi:hypothetical protein